MILILKKGDFVYSINFDKIAEADNLCGFFCVDSNTSFDNTKNLKIYRTSDITENFLMILIIYRYEKNEKI
jgi:hypothetical protein